MEMTTEEIVESLEPTPVNEQALAKLKDTFMLADLVKFAKAQPLPVENDLSLNNAVDFVKETMHIEQAPVQTEEVKTENVQKPEENDKKKLDETGSDDKIKDEKKEQK
jgi:hypothetical protein